METNKHEESTKDRVLGYHDLPLWTQYGVLSEPSKTKSLLVVINCPYCQNNVSISVTPNIGTISVSVECSCCHNQIHTDVDSSFKEDCKKIARRRFKNCKVF